MSLIAVTASNPTRLDAPSLVLNHSATDPIHLICAIRSVDHGGDQTFEDIETVCQPGAEAPGATTEALDVEVLLSHGATGVFNVMKPLQGTLVPFAYKLNGGAALGVGNQEMSGSCYVPFVPFIRATGVKKFSYVPMSFKIVGIPIYNSVTPVYAGHTGTS